MKKRYLKESDSAKECRIIYGGKWAGPLFVLPNFGHQTNYKPDPELEELRQQALELHLKSPNYDFFFTDKVVKFLNDHGWKVISNDYDHSLVNEVDEEDLEVFKDMLRNGEVKFSYRKVDGTVRKARGTIAQRLLPIQGDVDKAKRKRAIPDSVIVYFDLDANGFRSFRKDNFLGYELDGEEQA